MRHRIALVVGALAASATLAVALAAAGFGPADPSLASAVVAAPASPHLQVDTVYIPAPVQPQTITVHQVVSGGGGDDGEGGGDD